MESAFRTVVSGLGVVAACYLLTAATWIQVLLLFLAACLGWCLFTTLMAIRPNRTPSPSARAKKDRMADKPAAAKPVIAEPKPPRASVYRFPIDQLTATRIPMPELGQ